VLRKLSLCAAVVIATGASAAHAADIRLVPAGKSVSYPRHAYYMPSCFESPYALVLHCAPLRDDVSPAYVRYDALPFIPRRPPMPYPNTFRW
jgi:hypothetical protein